MEDPAAAASFGLTAGQVCLLIHSGSRGLGYQVCDDSLRSLRQAPAKYGIDLPDRQLVCAPVDSDEGRHYLGAMRAAANYSFCNRQLLLWQCREVFSRVFGRSWESLGMELLYDVAHNMAKIEEHGTDGDRRPLCVHRKGATRAFPTGPRAVLRHHLSRRGPLPQPDGRPPGPPVAATSQKNWLLRASSPKAAAVKASLKSSPLPTRTSMWWSTSCTVLACRSRWPGCGRWG